MIARTSISSKSPFLFFTYNEIDILLFHAILYVCICGPFSSTCAYDTHRQRIALSFLVTMFTICEAVQDILITAKRMEDRVAEDLQTAEEFELPNVPALETDVKAARSLNDQLLTLWNELKMAKKASDEIWPATAVYKLDKLQAALDSTVRSPWGSEAFKMNSRNYCALLVSTPELLWMNEVIWTNIGRMSESSQQYTLELQMSLLIFKNIVKSAYKNYNVQHKNSADITF